MLLLAASVAGSSWFQTWAVRRWVAQQAAFPVEIGRVEIGWRRIVLEQVSVRRLGVTLAAPRVEAELGWFDYFSARKLLLGDLKAEGWQLDLSHLAWMAAAVAPDGPRSAADSSTPPPAAWGAGAALRAMHGLLGGFQLPFDLGVERVTLAGSVVWPGRLGRSAVSFQGGGLRSGHEGSFEFGFEPGAREPTGVSVAVRGNLKAGLDSPRTLSSLALKADVVARGPAWPQGFTLTVGATAARSPAGEVYSARIVGEERQLFALKAEYPRDNSRLEGTWSLQARRRDVEPFAGGRALPDFAVEGQGRFDADAAFSVLHVTGRFAAEANGLEVIRPEFAAVGMVKIGGVFECLKRGEIVTMPVLELDVGAARPVASARMLQRIGYNFRTGALVLAEAQQEVASLTLHALPAAWLRPWFPDWVFAGGDIEGELRVGWQDGGATVRSREMLRAARVSFGAAQQRWFDDVEVATAVRADFMPKGWQLELSGLSLRHRGGNLGGGEIRLGRLQGEGQPLKATLRLRGELAAWRQQPIVGERFPLQAGDVEVDLALGLGEKVEVQGTVSAHGLAAERTGRTEPLAAGTVEVRAEYSAAGGTAFNLPLVFEREGRKSDLLLVGRIGPDRVGERLVEAQFIGEQVHWRDVEFLAALPGAGRGGRSGVPARAPWHPFTGGVSWQVGRLLWPGLPELVNTTGRLRLESGALVLDELRGGFAGSGSAVVDGRISFDAARSNEPLKWSGHVQLREIDPAHMLSVAPPVGLPVEGLFDVAGTWESQGDSLAALAQGWRGRFQVTSRGGVFRALPISVGRAGDNTGAIASLLASASSMIGGITGRRESGDIANRSQAIAELARVVSGITFDQLSVTAVRNGDASLTLSEFSLLAPEVRMSGGGRTLSFAGRDWRQDALALELSLRTRGRAAELLRYLGLLDPQVDDLGYSACTVPITVGGTWGNIDASDTSRRLVAAAFAKAGFIDKAAEWLAKQRGRPVRTEDPGQDAGK